MPESGKTTPPPGPVPDNCPHCRRLYAFAHAAGCPLYAGSAREWTYTDGIMKGFDGTYDHPLREVRAREGAEGRGDGGAA